MIGSLGEYLVEETREEITVEIAANMLKENVPVDIISRITSLPVDRIAEVGKMRGLL